MFTSLSSRRSLGSTVGLSTLTQAQCLTLILPQDASLVCPPLPMLPILTLLSLGQQNLGPSYTVLLCGASACLLSYREIGFRNINHLYWSTVGTERGWAGNGSTQVMLFR